MHLWGLMHFGVLSKSWFYQTAILGHLQSKAFKILSVSHKNVLRWKTNAFTNYTVSCLNVSSIIYFNVLSF